MTNLLEETLSILKEEGLTPDDVIWCGNREFRFTWVEFAGLAKQLDYDSGYGSQKVATDLMIVGKDFWMSRNEYDGSEWWVFHRKPKMPEIRMTPKSLGGNDLHYPTLGELL